MSCKIVLHLLPYHLLITIQRPEHYLDPSKIAKKDFYTSDTPPSEKRDEIPIQNDYSVYVQLNGHSG